MKRRISLFLCTLVFAISLLTLGAVAQTFTPDNDGLYSVELTMDANNDYILFVLKGEYDQTNYIEALAAADDADIIYYAQRMSDKNGKVTFGPFAPNGYYDATLIVGGTNLEEPVLAGYISAKGVSNTASVEIFGVEGTYVANGMNGEDIKIEVETEVYDSFGYPSMVDSNVTLSLVNNGDDVSFDGKVITISKMAKAQAFTVVATAGEATSVSYVIVERNPSVRSYISIYEDADMTKEVDAINVSGAAGANATVTVYAKTFDQYGQEMSDSYSYLYGTDYVESTFTPTYGTVKLTIKSASSSITKVVDVIAKSRPAYGGSSLELYDLLISAKAKIAEEKIISAESGKDVYPDTTWTTQSAVDTFASAIANAEAALEKYGTTGYGDNDYSAAVTTLTRAISSYEDSFKAGKRIDVTEVSISQQNVVLAIGETKLTAVTVPNINMTTDKITWTSSDTSIATVDASTGAVKGLTSGTVTITAETRAGLKATTLVTFVKTATKIELTPSKTSVEFGGKTEYLEAKIYGTDSTDIVEWTIDKPELLDLEYSEYVAETGHRVVKAKLIPKASGTAKVTAKAVYGNKTATSTVTVTMPAWETAKAPVADVKAGSVLAGTPVSLITETAGATIYYTLDGSTPSKSNGRLYKNPIILTKSLTLKAIAVCDGMYDSEVSEYTYEVVNSSIEISSALGKTGSTVELFVSGTAFENVNKSYITLKYNTDALTILGTTALEGLDVAYYEDTVAIIYKKSDVEFAGGRYAKILFKIAEDAPEGKYVITVNDGRIEASLDGEDGGTTEFNAVLFSGVITVKNYLPGDANGDDVIGLADVLIIKQYLAGNENAKKTILLDAADVNADGKVDNDDVTLLSKYCVGWNVTFGAHGEVSDYRIVSNYDIAADSEDNWRNYYGLYNPTDGFKTEDVPSVSFSEKASTLSTALEAGTVIKLSADGTVDESKVIGKIDENSLVWIKSMTDTSMTVVPVDATAECKNCATEYVSSYKGTTYNDFIGNKQTSNVVKIDADTKFVSMTYSTFDESFFKWSVMKSETVADVKATKKNLLCYNDKSEDKDGYYTTTYSDYVKALVCADSKGVAKFVIVIVNGDENAAYNIACANCGN